ncbi:MAG: META domain-containing protein [Chloroflexota bacterium]
MSSRSSLLGGMFVVLAGVAIAAGAVYGASVVLAGGAPVSPLPPGAGNALAGTSWRLVAFEEGQPPLEGSEITLEFAAQERRAGGRASVNHYTSAVTIQEDQLTFGPIISTKIAGPEPLMEQEARYFAALEQTRSYRLAAGQLTLFDAGNQPLLVFVPSR